MTERKPGAAFSPRDLTTWIVAAVALLLVAALGVILGAAARTATGTSGVAQTLTDIAIDAGRARAGDAKAVKALADAGARLQSEVSDNEGSAWARDARLPVVLRMLDAMGRSSAATTNTLQAASIAAANVPQLNQLIGELTKRSPDSMSEPLARVRERFVSRALQLQLDLTALADGADHPATITRRLADSADYLGQVVAGLEGKESSIGALPKITGAEAIAQLAELHSGVANLTAAVRRAVTAAPRTAGSARQVETLTDNVRALAEIARHDDQARGSAPWWPAIFVLLAMAPLWLIWRQVRELRAEADRQRLAAATQHLAADRNQEAILRLLDELSSLADGDLTVQATVTEDMTGAIADSINYAVDALRGLVTTINQSAISLDGATKQTQALAQHLTKASSAQSRQIGQASESVAEMAGSTEEVSGNAERAADVARHSVDVAHKGGDAVRRTIDGMNAIRETIQETSKRIKRLGESSQEIGNIVELINDIAEQTNILALNASIQASMAGEAGRGFAVVADEVQRLAERAANATKQIEVLVRTIQSDTNEAVVSMERSTADVVGGALLAENAGAALEEIEQVSNQIASLVQNISGSARQQSGSAQAIARNMSVLKEISSQTAESTGATSQQIARLADLSADLRRSVAGFRLPGSAEHG